VFIEAKDDGSGGNNWSYKSCKAPVKSPPPTNQQKTYFRASLYRAEQESSVIDNEIAHFGGTMHLSKLLKILEGERALLEVRT